MNLRTTSSLAALALTATAGFAQIAPVNEDFESKDDTNPLALETSGWLVFGNVWDTGGNYLYGYGPFGAPNHGLGFSVIGLNMGGPAQGGKSLVTYSDYQNANEHNAGNPVEANVFLEQTIDAGDVGKTFEFTFDAQLGDIGGATTAEAFIKVIDSTVFSLDGYANMAMEAVPNTWNSYSLQLLITSDHIGDYFQIGFSNTCTNWENSGMHYDNISLTEQGNGPIGTNYCGPANANSSGNPAVISATGSTSAAANDVTLDVVDLPTGQWTMFINSQTQGFVSPPNSSGNLCVVGQIGRYKNNIMNSGAGGTVSLALDLTNTPTPSGSVSVMAGETWNFQLWFRDVGNTSNFSDAIEITFN